MPETYEVAIVGRGIVGLAHALAAARTGARVVVIDREPAARGASIRNFGFVTVSGQARGEMWNFARRSRDIWAEIAPAAGITVDQRGLLQLAQRREGAAILEAFLATEMGEGCELLDPTSARTRFGLSGFADFSAAMFSPHELRVEPRLALPALAEWLATRYGVEFQRAAVIECAPGVVCTAVGDVRARRIFICPGDDVTGLFPEVMARHRVTRCKLQMLRIAPSGRTLPTPIMSDLSLIRYEGFAALDAAAPLRERLLAEHGALIDAGVHLIAVQSADGSLVVGDSHEYDAAPDPYQRKAIDDLILTAFRETLPGFDGPIVEHWTGTYAWSPDHNWFSKEVAPGVHLTLVTSGAGMSTGFAIGEQVVAAAMASKTKEMAQ